VTITPNARGPLFDGLPAGDVECKPGRVARAHKADPQPSHAAANRHNRTGKAGTNLARVVRMATALPGRTAGEIAEQLAGLDYMEVQKRLSDAKRLRLLLCGTPRECRIRGTRMSTWHANPDAPTGTGLDVQA
jgi:hypothetical protein